MLKFQVGEATISCIHELEMPGVHFHDLIRNYDADIANPTLHLLPDGYYEHGAGVFSALVHNWLVQIGGRTVMIDTGFGNDKVLPGLPSASNLKTDFLGELAAAGVQPEDVDMILCTHLHIDHVGWNTRWNGDAWVPTFPNARYIFTRIERDHWEPSNPGCTRDITKAMAAGVFEQGVQPILDAGLAELVEPDARIDDVFQFIPTPGHSPGHVAIRLSDGGEGAIFCADVMHHPIQILHPQWNSVFCEEEEEAIRSRRKILSLCADEDLILCPAHFVHGACHVRREGEDFRLSNLAESERI